MKMFVLIQLRGGYPLDVTVIKAETAEEAAKQHRFSILSKREIEDLPTRYFLGSRGHDEWYLFEDGEV